MGGLQVHNPEIFTPWILPRARLTTNTLNFFGSLPVHELCLSFLYVCSLRTVYLMYPRVVFRKIVK